MLSADRYGIQAYQPSIEPVKYALKGMLMKAMQVNASDQGPVLILAELKKPEPGSGEILIHVHAAGVTLDDRVLRVQHARAGVLDGNLQAPFIELLVDASGGKLCSQLACNGVDEHSGFA